MATILKVKKLGERACIELGAKALNEGMLVAYPTETSYGLGCNALDRKAIRRLRSAKGLKKKRQLSVIIASKARASDISVLNPSARRTLKLMPGPISVVAARRKNLPRELGKGNTVCFRVSSNRIARGLAKKSGKPIVSTSANISGKGDLYSGKEVEKALGKRIYLIIDAGKLHRTRPSTIYDSVSGKILRSGPISERQLKKALGEKK